MCSIFLTLCLAFMIHDLKSEGKIEENAFCTSASAQCHNEESQKLLEGWKVSLYVNNPEASQTLKQFVQISLPKLQHSNLAEIMKQCQDKTFKFPDFPDYFGPNHLERRDESNDAQFYTQPRLVTHIDDFAIESLMNYYEKHLKSGSKVLDLCSSWISHLPKSLTLDQVIGIGMNEKELGANKRLTQHFVHDLNLNPELKMIEDESLDAVLCTVSVDYLIRPFEVFKEVYRVLKPGGSFIVSFSNRMFATKAIKAWIMTGDPAHIHIVALYFQASAEWKEVSISDVTQKSDAKQHRDPLYVIHGIK